MVSPSFGIPPAPQCARCLWAALHISPNCLIYNILSFPIKEGWMSTAVLSILLFAQQMYEKYRDRRRKSQGGKKRRVESLLTTHCSWRGSFADRWDGYSDFPGSLSFSKIQTEVWKTQRNPEPQRKKQAFLISLFNPTSRWDMDFTKVTAF